MTAGKLTNMKNTVDPWAARMGVETALLAQKDKRAGAHDRWEGGAVRGVRACAVQGGAGEFDGDAGQGSADSGESTTGFWIAA